MESQMKNMAENGIPNEKTGSKWNTQWEKAGFQVVIQNESHHWYNPVGWYKV